MRFCLCACDPTCVSFWFYFQFNGIDKIDDWTFYSATDSRHCTNLMKLTLFYFIDMCLPLPRALLVAHFTHTTIILINFIHFKENEFIYLQIQEIFLLDSKTMQWRLKNEWAHRFECMMQQILGMWIIWKIIINNIYYSSSLSIKHWCIIMECCGKTKEYCIYQNR